MNPLSPEITKFVRCPVTKTELVAADDELVAKLNKQIAAGELVNNIGQKVDSPVEGGFTNEDQSLFLAHRGGIVILISDQAIPLDQVK